MKPEHKKKTTGAIISAVAVFIMYTAYGIFLISVGLSAFEPWMIFVGALIPLVIGGLLFAVTSERINEIKGGQEDDLSKY